MRPALVGLLLFYFTSSLSAQPEDSLKQQLAPAVSDSAEVAMMIDLSAKFRDSGSMQESMRLLRNARKKADSLNNAYLIQQVNTSLADNYLSADQPDSAVIVLQKALNQSPSRRQKIDILNFLGTAYRFQADYRQSLKTYKKAMALTDSAKSPRMVSVIKQNMAVVHDNLGNMATALKYYLEGIEYAEGAKDSLLLTNVLNNLGEAYNDRSQFEDAEYYLERSLKLSKELGFTIGIFRAVSNLANTKKNLGNFDKALSLYQYALSLHHQIRPDVPPFRIIHNLGNMHLQLGNLGKAEENFSQSLKYSKESGIPQGLFYNYTGLADVAEQRGALAQAIDFHRQALDVAKSLGTAQFRKSAIEEIYLLYKELNKYGEALTYHEKFKTIADSIREAETEQKFAKTEAMLNLHKQEQINTLLQQKQQEQQARITTQNWLIAAGMGIIAVVLASVVLLYRSREEKQRINRELELQRNQLEQMNKVKDKILAIIAHDLRSPLASMQSMLYLLREDDLSHEDIDMMTTQLELSISQNISMMDNLLAWAKEQMSGLAVNVESIMGRKAVEETFDNFEFQARQKGVSLINNVAEGLKVQADYNLLKLILRNLVANSIKFTKEGDAITVSTRQENGKIVFDVNDTGIGIPEEDQRDLFTIHGGSREGTNHEKGSGLGLQLCKEFVEKQKGEIAVKSIEGEGTTFSFSLPRAS